MASRNWFVAAKRPVDCNRETSRGTWPGKVFKPAPAAGQIPAAARKANQFNSHLFLNIFRSAFLSSRQHQQPVKPPRRKLEGICVVYCQRVGLGGNGAAQIDP